MAIALAILVDGVDYAAWLFIVAVGLTLIYGVMKVLNVAHGAFYSLGAYSAAWAAASISMKAGRPPAASRCWRSPRSWLAASWAGCWSAASCASSMVPTTC
ncbi:MAG: ABC transporter permease subunit [Stellaceae bacterium]